MLVHLIWWRISLPRRQTKALLAIFLTATAASILLLALLTRLAPEWQGYGPDDLWEYLHIAEMVLALGLAYIVTYSALEVDSPSLVIALAIADQGTRGLAAEDLARAMNDERLIRPRVEDLVLDQMAFWQGERLLLTPKGQTMARLFAFYRRLLGKGLGG
jgi:hypothetical protein